MPNNQTFAVLAQPLANPAAAGGRPQPGTPGVTYLLALLDSQEALNVALDALVARAAVADAEETAYIQIQKGNIQADYLKLDAMVNAYLARQAIFTQISEQDLTAIRALLDRMQGFTATRDKASKIMAAVTELLNKWTPKQP